MLIPKNYPRLIANRDKSMPDQKEALKELRELRADRKSDLDTLRRPKKLLDIVNFIFIKKYYPDRSKEVIQMAKERFFTSYQLGKQTLYKRDKIENYIKNTVL